MVGIKGGCCREGRSDTIRGGEVRAGLAGRCKKRRKRTQKEEKRWDPLKIETHGGGDRNFGPRTPASLEEAFAKMR